MYFNQRFHLEFFLAVMHRMEKYVFDEKFEKNILIVRMRKIDCGKTSFVQKIGVNNLFSTLKKAK